MTAPENWTVTSKSELARFLHSDRATVRKWIAQGLPGGQRGPWHLSSVTKWLFAPGGPWYSRTARQQLLREELTQ